MRPWPNPPAVAEGYGTSDDTRCGDASNVITACLYKHNTQKRKAPPVEGKDAIVIRRCVWCSSSWGVEKREIVGCEKESSENRDADVTPGVTTGERQQKGHES